MEQLYDRALKALMEDHAAEMLPELLPGAELVSVENTELNRPNLRADLVYLSDTLNPVERDELLGLRSVWPVPVGTTSTTCG